MWAETLAGRHARLDEQRQRPARLPLAATSSPPTPGPAAAPIRAAGRLAGAVPPTGVTGAVFDRGRLLLAGESDGTYQVWGVNPRDGKRRLELELKICGESEGLDVIPDARRRAALADRALRPRLHADLRARPARCCTSRGGPGRSGLRGEGAARSRAGALPGSVRAKVRVTRAGRRVRRRARELRRRHAPHRPARHGDRRARRSSCPGRFKALARAGRALRAVGVRARRASGAVSERLAESRPRAPGRRARVPAAAAAARADARDRLRGPREHHVRRDRADARPRDLVDGLRAGRRDLLRQLRGARDPEQPGAPPRRRARAGWGAS